LSIFAFSICACSFAKNNKMIKHALLEQLQLAKHARLTNPEGLAWKGPKIIRNAHISRLYTL
jgi:hypothetical protein